MNRHQLSSSVFALLLMSAGGSVGCGGDPINSDGATTGSGGSGTDAASSTGGGTGGVSSSTTTGGDTGGESSGSGGSGGGGTGGLNPNVAPGLNFDLSLWELQEPIGVPKSPTTISSDKLMNGFQDDYFYTDKTDGAMTFWDPITGVTTGNSDYPRSELRELNPNGSGANWPVAGTNTLSATLAVVKVPSSVCVGQIHIGKVIKSGLPESTKPLLELYYHKDGSLVLGIENSPSGGQTAHPITTIPLGTKFSYKIELKGNGKITLTVNGTPKTFTMPSSFNGYGEYFKAGNYDQTLPGDDPTIGALVKFYALKVSHTP
jgi:Alginate lyase